MQHGSLFALTKSITCHERVFPSWIVALERVDLIVVARSYLVVESSHGQATGTDENVVLQDQARRPIKLSHDIFWPTRQ